MVDDKRTSFIIFEPTLEGGEHKLGEDSWSIAVLNHHLVELSGVHGGDGTSNGVVDIVNEDRYIQFVNFFVKLFKVFNLEVVLIANFVWKNFLID